MWLFISENWFKIAWWCYFLAIFVVTTVMIINHTKRDPIRTMMWVIVLYFIPVIGLILYIFFGQNFRKSKIFNRKTLRDLKYIDKLTAQQLVKLRDNDIFEHYPQKSGFKNIMTLLLNNSKALLTQYNSIDIYYNGKDTFDEIKKCLRQAKDHIHLEFYIIQDDKIGNEIKDILVSKAKSGVDVRVIYDDVGSWDLSKKYINEIKKAGGSIYPFMRVAFPFFTSRVNYRNHRKIIVIDGKTAFMGGINIADRYIDGGEFSHWADAHIKIEGEAVSSLQTVFLVDWYFVSRKILLKYRNRYYPAQKKTDGHKLVQIVTSGPDSDWAGIMQAYFACINNAKHHIYISTPYFTPNESILTAIKTASLSGVDVKLMLPAKVDSKLVYWSTLSYLTDLMEAGVKIYLYNNGFNHSKFITVDGKFSAIGSANIDMRSFEHNFEVSAIIYDENTTQQLEHKFKTDIQKYCTRVNPVLWKKRPRSHVFREGFARLLTPLL